MILFSSFQFFWLFRLVLLGFSVYKIEIWFLLWLVTIFGNGGNVENVDACNGGNAENVDVDNGGNA